MKIKSLRHAGMCSWMYKELKCFYMEVLGMEVESLVEESKKHLQRMQVFNPGFETKKKYSILKFTCGLELIDSIVNEKHMAFNVEGIEEIYRQLKKPYIISDGIVRDSLERKILVIKDPAGNILELVEE